MKLTKKPYRGTRDFFPYDKRVQNYLFDTMRKTALSFGHEEYEGPLLEEVELYKAKSGEELINDQIYSFKDRGNRFVAIRPEMTPTLARMVAQVYRETTRPIRWFSIPNLMRYEKPQKGRLREHWQFNCDIFDAPGRHGELEILQLAIQLMNNFGANSSMFEILINDRSIVDATFNRLLKLESDKAYKLYKIVDRSKKISEDALHKMVSELNLSENQDKIFFEYLSIKSFEQAKDFLKKYKLQDELNSLKDLTDLIELFNLNSYLTYDPTIVRGLDYYTGVVFEIFDKHPENRRAICGGGSYANLLKIFNEEPLKGVGFGLGDVTLTDFLKTHNLLPNLTTPTNDVVVTFQDPEAFDYALKVSKKLRDLGLNIVSSFQKTKFNKAFSLAEKKGATLIALIGSQELEEEKIQFKNIRSKEQYNFNFDNLNEINSILKKD